MLWLGGAAPELYRGRYGLAATYRQSPGRAPDTQFIANTNGMFAKKDLPQLIRESFDELKAVAAGQ